MLRRRRTPCFGKPRWKRAEPREIAASSAAPELFQQTPEPLCADNSEPSDGWQSRPVGSGDFATRQRSYPVREDAGHLLIRSSRKAG